MNNKVNVKIVVPEIDKNYNVFLPVNKKMISIIKLINKMINELSNGDFPIAEKCKLYNAETLETYDPNLLLYNTNIRNGTNLVLLTF